MCKKFVLLMFLLTFVGTAAFAEDLNPPPWAGAPGSVYVLEEFNEDSPEVSFNSWGNIPEDQLMVPHPEGYEIDPDRYEWLWEENETVVEAYGEYESPVWSNQGWKTNRAEWHETYEGRQGVFQTPGFGVAITNFEGEGTKYIWIQMVKTGDPHTGCEFEGEPDAEGEFFFYEQEFELVNEIDLGNDWFHYTYFFEVEFNPAWEAMTMFTGDENLAYIDQYVIDTICFLGDEPPLSPCRGCVRVSNESPAFAATGIKHYVDTQLSFQAPRDANCMAEPNLVGPDAEDVNDFLQGPFEYTVLWGGDDPDKNNMAVLDVCSPAECNAVMRFDPVIGELAPGTTYYWAVDINDLNETDFRPGGNPSLYEGPVFPFTTWGFATLISPENNAEGVDAGTVELLFETDGYADDVNIFLLSEGEVVDSQLLTADANSWTPSISIGLSQTYEWYVEECNTPGCVASETWSFSTAVCKTLDDFESYTDLEGTGNAWKDWYDDETSTNAVINHLQDSTLGGASADLVYQWDPPDSVKSMNVNVDRDFLDATYEDYTWFTPADANLASNGGTSVWVAYRAADSVSSPPDTANNEQIFMGFESSDSNTANIDYPGDVCDTEWSIFFVALSEATDQGVDVTDIAEIRLGATGDDDNTGTFDIYFDLLTRCGPICPFDYGYPDEVQGAFAPPYVPLDSDLVQDCIVNAADLGVITGAWLDIDDYLYPEEPCEANLVLELKFDSDLTDTSASAYTVVAGGSSPPVVADGVCTFDGDGWLTVPDMNSLNLFEGDTSFTIAIDYISDGRFVLFSSARDPSGNFDLDGSKHPLHVFEGNCNMFQGNWFAGEVSMGGYECIGNIPLTVVTSYDSDSNDHTIYRMDEIQPYALKGNTGNWDPNIPEPELDTVMIGSSRCTECQDDVDIPNFEGTMDNIRVYNYVLSPEEILYLKYQSEDVMLPVDELANMDSTPYNGDQIINFFDQAEFAPQWQMEKLFE
ncbi:MAG: hypothetical protein ACYSUL_02825 [Planctomycetota bacterium]|jgi:hypothetical protein